MSKRDYYEVLGIDRKANKEAIKKAYRNLAKKYHPDRNKEAGAEEQFREIQEAYEVLSDEQKRSAYDQYGFAGTQGFGGMGGDSGFGGFGGFDGNINDIFEQFFGGDFGFAGRSARPQAPSKGPDIETTLKLTFEEAIFGTERELHYKRYVVCDECKGSGAEGGKTTTCETCGGRGQVLKTQRTFFGQVQTAGLCPTCQGEGKVATHKCKKCGGDGRVQISDNFTIKIPAGIPDSVTLRFAGRGNVGKRGGDYGDLYINIEISTHESLTRKGDDIYLDWEIDAVTAVLGGEIEIPTVWGKTKIKVPAGTQPEKVIKLSNQGGPQFKNTERKGDQYVRFKVIIPQKLTRQQSELWQKLRELN
jgi:molecular chaperone DnaJ